MLQENNNKVVSADLDALKLLMLDTIYPVGSIYMSVNNVSPSNLFGGSWEQIEDTFLLAAGSTYTAGDTGGSATHVPSGTLSGGAVGNHTLTIAEMPNHEHKYDRQQWYSADTQTSTSTGTIYSWKSSTGGTTSYGYQGGNGQYGPVGGGGAHNHPFTQPTFTGTAQNTMPPYLAVYMWKRTA